MTKTKRPIKCDYCGSTENVKEILYGMPSGDYDQSKYVLGGCMPGEANRICSNCDLLRQE